MRIRTKYDFGQIVYLTTDSEQLPRLVVGIDLTPGQIIYAVQNGTVCSKHYDFELSTTKDVVMKTTD